MSEPVHAGADADGRFRARKAKLGGWQQLLATGQFVECIFSCGACGESGTSVARPHMLEGKTCSGCGEPVSVTVI